MGYLAIERHQVGQAGSAFPKPTLARPGLLVVLCMLVMALWMISITFPSPEVRLELPPDPPSSLSGTWASHLLTSSQLGSPRLARTAGKQWKVSWQETLMFFGSLEVLFISVSMGSLAKSLQTFQQ